MPTPARRTINFGQFSFSSERDRLKALLQPQFWKLTKHHHYQMKVTGAYKKACTLTGDTKKCTRVHFSSLHRCPDRGATGTLVSFSVTPTEFSSNPKSCKEIIQTPTPLHPVWFPPPYNFPHLSPKTPGNVKLIGPARLN